MQAPPRAGLLEESHAPAPATGIAAANAVAAAAAGTPGHVGALLVVDDPPLVLAGDAFTGSHWDGCVESAERVRGGLRAETRSFSLRSPSNADSLPIECRQPSSSCKLSKGAWSRPSRRSSCSQDEIRLPRVANSSVVPGSKQNGTWPPDGIQQQHVVFFVRVQLAAFEVQ